MIEVIKLLVVIVFVIFLIKKKWNLGYIMLLASLLLGAFFNLNPSVIGLNFFLAILDPLTLRLIGIIVLVFILSAVLRKVESLKNLIDSLQELVKDYRLILAFIPAFLGLIPMPAGAILSAPMVKKLGDRMKLTPEEDTFVNYWFRHVWEFVWPLFSGIILFSALLEVEIREIIITQFPLTITAIILGLVWEQKYLKKNFKVIDKKSIFFNLKKLFFGTWPILLIIILVLFIKLDLLISLGIVILSLLILNINRIKIEYIREIIIKDIDLGTVLLIVGIMIFKRMFQVSGAIMIIPEFFNGLGVPPLIILFTIPFLVGILTGFSSAAIGIGFPVLLPFIIQGNVNLNYAMFAFVGSFVGVMFSPTHLCLVVTRDYFKADLGKIYKMLALPLLIIILSALILAIVRT